MAPLAPLPPAPCTARGTIAAHQAQRGAQGVVRRGGRGEGPGMTDTTFRWLAPMLALTMLAGAPAAAKPAATKPAAAKPAAAKPAADKLADKPAPVAKGRLYAVLIGPGAKWKKGQPFKGPGLDQHRAYWKKLFGEGRVASAGPLGEDIGLILLRARDQREANALVAADPAVKAQVLRGVARPYASALTSVDVLAAK